MAEYEVLVIDTSVPEIRAPGAGDTYGFPRAISSAITIDTGAGAADAGIIRLENGQPINWRNFLGTGNLGFQLGSGDLFTFDAGLSITGSISLSGTVDGVDISALGTAAAPLWMTINATSNWITVDSSEKIYTTNELTVNHSAHLATLDDFFGNAMFPTFAIHGSGEPTSGAVAEWSNGSTAYPSLFLTKSRGGSVGTHTIVQNGDPLGRIAWGGSNGSSFKYAAAIFGEVDGTPGAGTDMPGRLVFKTTPDGSSTPTTALTLDSAQDATFTGSILLSASETVDGVDISALGTAAAPLWMTINANANWITVDSGENAQFFGNTIWLNPVSGAAQILVDSASGSDSYLDLYENAVAKAQFRWDAFNTKTILNSSANLEINSGGTLALTLDSSQNATFAGNVVLAADQLFGVGGSTGNNYHATIGGSFTSGGAGTSSAKLLVGGTLTGATGDTGYLAGVWVTTDITTQGATETISDVTSLRLDEPTITVGTGDTITNASTLLITGAPTEGTNNYALLIDSGDFYMSSGDMIVNGQVSFNSSITDYYQHSISGNWTSGGSSTSSFKFVVSGGLTGASGDVIHLAGQYFTTNITTQAVAETVSDVAQLILDEPAITNSTATITNASTLLITGAPTEGTNNYAILVDSGASYFGGSISADGGTFSSTLSLNDNIRIEFGTDGDYWMDYITSNDRFRFRATDVDGIGTDGNIFYIDNGTDDVKFAGNISVGGADRDYGTGYGSVNGYASSVLFNSSNESTYLVSNYNSAVQYVQNGYAGACGFDTSGTWGLWTAPSGLQGNAVTLTRYFTLANTGAATFTQTIETETAGSIIQAGADEIIFNTNAMSTTRASIGASGTNLHIDSQTDGNMYLNYYGGGNIYLGDGASTTNVLWNPANLSFRPLNDAGASLGLTAQRWLKVWTDEVTSTGEIRCDEGPTWLGGSGTIAGATWANGTFHLGSGTSGWAMDSNEFYNSGAGIIGSLTGGLTINPVGDYLTVGGLGMIVSGTIDQNGTGNNTFAGPLQVTETANNFCTSYFGTTVGYSYLGICGASGQDSGIVFNEGIPGGTNARAMLGYDQNVDQFRIYWYYKTDGVTAVNSNRWYVDVDGNTSSVGDSIIGGVVTQNGTGNNTFDGDIYLNGSTPFLQLGSGSLSTASVVIKVGTGRTANGYAYMDFVGDTTYSDYGLRIIRNNTGANTTSVMYHRGTGQFSIRAVDAGGSLAFHTSNTARMTISDGSIVSVLNHDFSAGIDVTGNITVTGTVDGKDVAGHVDGTGSSVHGATSANTANQIVCRDANGDFYGRYLFGSYMNMSHGASTRSSDTVFYSSTDNYIRKNNIGGMYDSLKLGMNIQTEKATNTGATFYEFNNIPQTGGEIKRCVVMLRGVRKSNNNNLLVQIGNNTGLQASGYNSGSSSFSTGVGTVTHTAGAVLRTTLSTDIIDACIIFTRENESNDTWVWNGNFLINNGVYPGVMGGKVTISAGPLNRVRIIVDGGAATFNLGYFNVAVEY